MLGNRTYGSSRRKSRRRYTKTSRCSKASGRGRLRPCRCRAASIISVEDNLNAALDLVQACGRAYTATGPALRRH